MGKKKNRKKKCSKKKTPDRYPGRCNDSGYQYYCEYLCSNGEWWLQIPNAAEGFYCADQGNEVSLPACDADYEGKYYCVEDGIPETRDADKLGKKKKGKGKKRKKGFNKKRFCTYKYSSVHDTLLIVDGRCKKRKNEYCPVDLVAFFHEHMPAAVTEALLELARQDYGRWLHFTIDPIAIAACSQGRPPHGPQH